MKVLLCHKDIGDVDRGGICVLYKNLAQVLREIGVEVVVASQHELHMQGIKSIVLKSEPDPLLYSALVSDLIDEIQPDIVECSSWRFELLDYTKRTKRCAKVVVRCEPACVTLFPETEHFLEHEKCLCNNADMLIAVSQFAARDVITRYGCSEVSVVRNGIPYLNPTKIETFSDGFLWDNAKQDWATLSAQSLSTIIPPKRPLVYWIGKRTQMKGYDILCKIIDDLADSVSFIINIGAISIDYKDSLPNSKNILIVKDLSKLDQLGLMKHADLFLSTSRVEGFSIAIAEALSLGIPVIANEACEVISELYTDEQVRLLPLMDPSIELFREIQRSISKQKPHLPDWCTSHRMCLETFDIYKSLL